MALGLASMVVVGITGALLTISRVAGLDVLVGSPWGRVLAAKIAVFGVMVTTAAVAILFIGPRLRRARHDPVSPRDLKDRKANLAELSPMKMLEMVHEFVSKNFDDVGERFAEVALKIHHGEEDKRNIRGVTTEKEEETLREAGVDFVKIPVPKFDS